MEQNIGPRSTLTDTVIMAATHLYSATDQSIGQLSDFALSTPQPPATDEDVLAPLWDAVRREKEQNAAPRDKGMRRASGEGGLRRH